MNLLITIPCHLGDAAQSDRLITEIYHINNKRPQGNALIAFAPDVHAELRETIRISARLAFVSFEELELRAMAEPTNQKWILVNSVFRQVSQHVYSNCKTPFLWLEPDCIPTKAGWLDTLSETYCSQHRLNMGNHLVLRNGESELRFMGRVGIYDSNTALKVATFFDRGPFERTSGPTMVPATTKTRLIQQVLIQTVEDISKVWPEAVLVHGDKKGILRESLVPKPAPATNGHAEPIVIERGLTAVPPLVVQAQPIADSPIPKRRGRPPKVKV